MSLVLYGYGAIRHCVLWLVMTFSPSVMYQYGFNSCLKLCPHPSWLLQPLSVYHPLTTCKPQHTKAQYCVSSMCQDFKRILSSSPLLLLKSTSKRRCVRVSVFWVASAKTSVSARPGCQATAALEIPPVLTRRAERLSAPLNHWLQRKSLSLWAANV